MEELSVLNGDPLPWLLEIDPENPGVRFFTLKDILNRPLDDPEVVAAQHSLMTSGPVPVILAEQESQGYWVQPGPGYYPKYRGTVWQIIFLAQFGADGSDPRVLAGCDYVLDNSCSKHGGFSLTATPGGMIHCLQGNLVAALIDLGYLGDERLQLALDWLARSITGEGIASSNEKDTPVHYLKSGNSAPGFVCSANNQLPCAWGAVKAMLALSKVPQASQSSAVKTAIQAGIDFLFECDPAMADYPMGYSTKPSRSWFQFGYPIGYVTDVLQNLEVLVALGYGDDQRLENGRELLLGKQNARGRWSLEYTYNGKTWVEVEQKGKESKWVTLRALRVLKNSGKPD